VTYILKRDKKKLYKRGQKEKDNCNEGLIGPGDGTGSAQPSALPRSTAQAGSFRVRDAEQCPAQREGEKKREREEERRKRKGERQRGR